MALQNELYLAVLPQISLSPGSVGKTEEILTLLPDRNFATEFYKDEVDAYLNVFKRVQGSLTGGHVQGYQCVREDTAEGKVVIRVMQRVG